MRTGPPRSPRRTGLLEAPSAAGVSLSMHLQAASGKASPFLQGRGLFHPM